MNYIDFKNKLNHILFEYINKYIQNKFIFF